MAKKDFTTANTGRVYTAIEEATAEPEHEAQQAQEEQPMQEAQKAQKANKPQGTQGKKGYKAIRINMAFSPEVYEYIKTMARVRGENVTEFTNFIFAQSMEKNADLYEQAKKFINSFE